MNKIMYEGENYYVNKGAVYDLTFIELSKNISQKILKEYYNSIDYENLDETPLQEFIKDLKNSEIYDSSLVKSLANTIDLTICILTEALARKAQALR